VKVLALVGKGVDRLRVEGLYRSGDFAFARYGSVSRGVRRLEKTPADVVLLAPDPADDTWLRAVRRIGDEYRTDVVVLLPDESGGQAALEAGAFDAFRLDLVTPDDLRRCFLHLSRQKELERALESHRSMADWVEEAGRLGSWIMDGSGKTAWSRGARRIFNDRDGRLTHDFDSIRAFVHPEDVEVFEQANKATFEQGWPLDFEYRVRLGEETRYLHLHRRVEHGPGGEVARAFGMIRDVTPEREFENFLFRRDAVLQVVAAFAARFLRESDWESGLDDSLADLGRAMDVTRVYAFRKSRDKDGDETLSMDHEWAGPGQTPIICLPQMQNQSFDPLYRRLLPNLLDRKVAAAHVRNLHREERSFLERTGARSIMIVPVFAGNEWWGYLGFSEHREERDWLPVEIEAVTMVADIFGSAILRRDMEEQLRAANRRAEGASRAKSRFLANMSHEIRTPISGILGMVEMITDMDLSPEQREYLDMIGDAARSLLAIINDVLDLSRIEAHKMELAPQDFKLKPMLERTLAPFEALAGQKGLALRQKVSPDVPITVNGDPDRLAQVVRNLVSNAVKFTSSGFVEVEVGLESARPGSACLRFTVRDSGEGIPPDKLDDVFEMFVQADVSQGKRHPGVGLGLAISRELVEMMGGELGVKSEPGKGSVFSFTACFGAPASRPVPSPEPGPAETPGRLHVLLAEDNPLNRRVVTHFLTKAGHRVSVAGNGIEALEVLHRTGRDVDLVLMDIQMPEMGGIEATAAIRESDGKDFDPAVPIIALTAYAMRGDRERMLEAGMDEYVSKPIDMTVLAEVMARCADRGRDAAGDCGLAEAVTGDFDMQGLVDRFQGDMALLKDILALFLAEAAEKLENLDRGLARNDADEVGAALHSITSIASHVMAMDIVHASRCLERLCSEGRLAEARADVLTLRSAFEVLADRVRNRAGSL
jgi:signal transduction histidine kinase/FixJ family two-component response regulator/HPt (histidine-containing phosphotransfer) domain-containing protein/PAS domain-containing protein